MTGACDGANQGVQIGNGQNPDPVVIDFPIAYVRAPLPIDENGMFEQQDLREQITFDVGGQLFVKDRASPSAVPINITESIIGDQGAVGLVIVFGVLKSGQQLRLGGVDHQLIECRDVESHVPPCYAVERPALRIVNDPDAHPVKY